MGQDWVIKLDNAKFINRVAYLIGSIAVFVLLFSFGFYIAENKFQVEHITVTGNINRVTKDQLINVARDNLYGTMFTLDINDLEYEFKKIPWVKNVSVSRTFPDSVTVNITEYNAIAHYGDYGDFVAPDGQVFLGVINDPLLPTFYGPKNSVPDLLKVYNTTEALFKRQNITVATLRYVGIGIVKIVFSNGLAVTICGMDFSDKLSTLNKYWAQLYKINPGLNYVNMCYKNAVAINGLVNNMKEGNAHGKSNSF